METPPAPRGPLPHSTHFHPRGAAQLRLLSSEAAAQLRPSHPPVTLMRVSDATRSGASSARREAIMPPMEWPKMWALGQPKKSWSGRRVPGLGRVGVGWGGGREALSGLTSGPGGSEGAQGGWVWWGGVSGPCRVSESSRGEGRGMDAPREVWYGRQDADPDAGSGKGAG